MMIWHKMIWHIFKKDWRLMWPYSAGLAALQFAGMAALWKLGLFRAAPLTSWLLSRAFTPDTDRAFYVVTFVFPLLSYLASAFLIAVIVQQDPIPGVRQDWLVRPIRRRDLFFAKLVAVPGMVGLPIFAADFSGALLSGFPFSQSLAAALGRSVWLWCSLFLAVFALASLTRNLMEAIVAGTAVTALYVLLPTLLMLWRSPEGVFVRGRVTWLDSLIHLGAVLIGASILLGLQYALRKTFVSRILTAAFVIVLLIIPAVRWQTAFALEERLSRNPSSGNSVNISFAPDREASTESPVGPLPYDRSNASIMLPIRVTGVPDGAILYGESSAARIVTEEGAKWVGGYHMGIPTWRNEGGKDKVLTYTLTIPQNLYSRIADQPLRLEIDYYLTLLKLADTQTLPATGGERRSKGLGWCGTQVRGADGEIVVGCINTGAPPSCTSMVLDYLPTGASNPPSGICSVPDYSPFRFDYGPDALARFTERLPFGNAGGIDQYPVKSFMLPQSRVKINMYEAEDHFERRLTIPRIRLRDWTAAD